MKVNLHDILNYLIHQTIVEGSLPTVLIWGERAFVKVGKRRYRETSMKVITDTE